MKKVEHLSAIPMGSNIIDFGGKSYEEAIQKAETWEKSREDVELISYYEQKTGFTILVSYKFK